MTRVRIRRGKKTGHILGDCVVLSTYYMMLILSALNVQKNAHYEPLAIQEQMMH